MEKAACMAALTALEKAMEAERQGKAFYEEAAERVQDPMGAAVFKTLAEDEVNHLRVLQAEYEKISKESKWMELDEAKVCEPQTPLKLFPDKREASFILPDNATDLEALQLAMQFEEMGYNLYAKAAEETDDPKGKQVFRFLAKLENEHFVFLQKTHDYLTNKGAWYFDEQEFPMFDGG
ncbi:MAG: ferritin family protein [Chloroflexi bacterium]|nr:ferritin family protein [Chloroflexota bacterium]